MVCLCIEVCFYLRIVKKMMMKIVIFGEWCAVSKKKLLLRDFFDVGHHVRDMDYNQHYTKI